MVEKKSFLMTPKKYSWASKFSALWRRAYMIYPKWYKFPGDGKHTRKNTFKLVEYYNISQ